MSQWIERIRNHQIWDALKTIEPAIESALGRDGISPDAIDSLERLRTISKFSCAKLNETDRLLIHPGILDSLLTMFTQVKALVDTFLTNGDVATLARANIQADSGLTTLSQLSSVSNSDLAELSEATSAFKETINKHLKDALSIQKQLSQKSSANEAKIADIEAALAAEQKKLAVLATEQQSQFSAAQDKRATDFAAAQAEFLAKFTTAITEQQTQFSTDQDSRKSSYAELERNSQQKLTSLMEQYDEKLKAHEIAFLEAEKNASETHKTNLEALDSEYKADATEILNQIRKLKTEVESLVGVIGNLGVTSGYKKVADQARRMLYAWQFLTVASLGGLILVAAAVAFPNLSQHLANETFQTKLEIRDINVGPTVRVGATLEKAEPTHTAAITRTDLDFYKGLATRIFLSLTFGIFAAYAGRQASHFLSIEQKNRKLALELEALGPFIEPLDKDERDKFRVQIGERSFGVPDHQELKPKGDDPVTVLDILKSADIKELIAALKEALKK